YWKIPLQALVLLVGVLVFVFYLFQAPPLLFNPAHESAVREGAGTEYAALEARHGELWTQREAAARALGAGAETARADFLALESEVGEVRTEALALAERVTGESSRDVNYIIPRFVLTQLPIGLAG